MEDKLYIDSLHAKMHEVFKAAIDFMESHNLKWYVSGGTAIGAIRHHDFIPWDDDIDIYMPRKDYNNLLALKNDIKLSTNLELVDIDDEGYTQWFAKFIDKGSTTVENLTIPLVYGVWVDVFPLDYSNKNVEEIKIEANIYRKLFLDYQHSLFRTSIKGIISSFCHFDLCSAKEQLLNFFFRKRKLRLQNKFKRFVESLYEETGEYLVSYCECGRRLNKEWFKSSIWVAFNNYQVRVPVGYDAYLRSVFGDYMILPKEQDRITHQMLYVNLRERLSLNEVKSRLGIGESFVPEH